MRVSKWSKRYAKSAGKVLSLLRTIFTETKKVFTVRGRVTIIDTTESLRNALIYEISLKRDKLSSKALKRAYG